GLHVAMLDVALRPREARQLQTGQVIESLRRLLHQLQQVIAGHMESRFLMVNVVQVLKAAVRALHNDDDVWRRGADVVQTDEIGVPQILDAAHHADLLSDQCALLPRGVDEFQSNVVALGRSGAPDLSEPALAQAASDAIPWNRFEALEYHG